MEPKYVRKILEGVRSSIMARFYYKKMAPFFLNTTYVCIFKITFMIDIFLIQLSNFTFYMSPTKIYLRTSCNKKKHVEVAVYDYLNT